MPACSPVSDVRVLLATATKADATRPSAEEIADGLPHCPVVSWALHQRRARTGVHWYSTMQLELIQQEIRNQKLDGWLFFDHHLRDPLAYRVLGFTAPRTPTRRWYYLIPAEGEPAGLAHRVEPGMIDALPGKKIPYSSWTEQVAGLRQLTAGLRRVAMQYSPMCAIPYVAMVDAGTVELVRSLGLEV